MLMFTRDNILSYVPYLGANAGAVAIEQKASNQGTIDVSTASASKTIEAAPWLHDVFPDAVSAGHLAVQDGHLYIYGLSVLEMASLVAIIVTFIFTAGKFLMDYKTYRRNAKVDKPSLDEVTCECGKIIKIEKKVSK